MMNRFQALYSVNLRRYIVVGIVLSVTGAGARLDPASAHDSVGPDR
jgi:hypothetical protein